MGTHYVSQEAFDEAAELWRNIATLENNLAAPGQTLAQKRAIKDQLTVMQRRRYECLGHQNKVAPYTEWEEAGAKAIYDLNNPHKKGERGDAWRMYLPAARAAIHARIP